MPDTIHSPIELQRLRQFALSIGKVAEKISERSIGLSIEDARIVDVLHQHPYSTATEIAKLTLLTPVQVGRRISRLRKMHYLITEADRLDARAIRLRLSPEGERICQRSRDITANIQAWAIRDLTNEEWEVFSRILDKLLASVADKDQERHVSELIAQLDSRKSA